MIKRTVAEWRKEMERAGIRGVELDELKSHLQEEMARRMRKGETEEQAFEEAVKVVGSAKAVQAEFRKIEGGRNWPLILGASVWGALMVFQAMRWGWTLRYGVIGSLLMAHIICIVVGYELALIAGVVGWSHVFLGTKGRRDVRRAVELFTRVAVVFAIAGLFLGMAWSEKYRGAYWSFDRKEMGGLGVCVWLAAMWAGRRFWRISDRAFALLGIGGGVVVSVAWFGPFLNLTSARLGLAAFLALNVAFFAASEIKHRSAMAGR